jgi:hypothetical protein
VSAPADKQPFVPQWLDDCGLSATRIRVLIHLWRRADWKSRRCFPGVHSIMTTCRVSENTAWKILAELEAGGYFKRIGRPGRSNVYEMQIGPGVPTANETVGGSYDIPQSDGRVAPQSDGVHPPQTEGLHPPQSKGCEGTPLKVSHRRDPKGGGSPPSLSVWPHVLSDAEIAQIIDGSNDLTAEMVKRVYPAFRDRKRRYKDPYNEDNMSDLRDEARKAWAKRSQRTQFASDDYSNVGKPEAPTIPPPNGWENVARGDEEMKGFAGREWATIPQYYQRKIEKLVAIK